jgi:mono/diheme cytochrome c family protein
MLLVLTNSRADEGAVIYKTVCSKCHNVNPTKPGSIGPELFTTPKEVFRTKVITGTYPVNYKPKRKTRIMPKFKNLTTKIDLIYNYIRSFKK